MGTWVFIFGDMAFFALLFGTYLAERAKQPTVFDAAQAHLDRGVGTAMTILLLTSSLLVVRGVSASNASKSVAGPRLMLGGLALGLGFVVLKILEYAQHVQAHQTPTTSNFWLYYYILTGLHLFHVVLGLIDLGVLAYLARERGDSRQRRAVIEGGASFWHMVDLLWVVLFPLLYFVR